MRPEMTSVMPPRLWALVGAAALMLIGAFGPWAQAFIVSVSGVDGTDGWIVVVLAVIAALCAYGYVKADKRGQRTGLMMLAVVAGVAGLAIFGVDGRDIFGSQTADDPDSLFGDVDLVSPGWGLIMVGIGSAGVTIIASSVLLRPVDLSQQTPSP